MYNSSKKIKYIILFISIILITNNLYSLVEIEKISSTTFVESFTPDKMFDNDTTTYWKSKEESVKEILLITFLNLSDVYSVEIFWHDGAAADPVNIVGSYDNNEYKQITFSKVEVSDDYYIFYFYPVEVKYLKVVLTGKFYREFAISNIKINGLSTEYVIEKVTASSKESDEMEPFNVIDNDMNTRWSSLHQDDPQHIIIQLADITLMEGIKIWWETAAAKEYDVQVSLNGDDWETVQEIKNGQEGEEKLIRFKLQPVKYIKVEGYSRVTEYGYSMWEIKLYPLGILPAICRIKSVAASSNNPKYNVKNVIDGDLSTRWGGDGNDNVAFLILELEEGESVSSLKINWETAAAKKYKIRSSEDGFHWKTMATVEDGYSEEERTLSFKSVSARFLKILMVEPATEWGYSIWEVEAYR